MKPTILYVDDDVVMLEMVAFYFRDQGYTVATASSGAQAMKAADAEQFDLAVFDINLEGENGLQLLSYFKANHPTVPVIMFTGLEEEELMDEALARGASGFMCKKAPLQDLCEAVRSYLPNS